MRISVCAKSVCPRCDQGRGGYVFPWLGIWNQRGQLCHLVSPLSRLGTGMQGWMPPWTSYFCSPIAAHTQLPILCHRTYGSSCRRSPVTWTSCPHRPSSPKFCITCGTGSWDPDMGCGPTPFVHRCRTSRGCPATWTPFTRRFVLDSPSWMVGILNQRRNGIPSSVLWLW